MIYLFSVGPNVFCLIRFTRGVADWLGFTVICCELSLCVHCCCLIAIVRLAATCKVTVNKVLVLVSQVLVLVLASLVLVLVLVLVLILVGLVLVLVLVLACPVLVNTTECCTLLRNAYSNKALFLWSIRLNSTS